MSVSGDVEQVPVVEVRHVGVIDRLDVLELHLRTGDRDGVRVGGVVGGLVAGAQDLERGRRAALAGDGVEHSPVARTARPGRTVTATPPITANGGMSSASSAAAARTSGTMAGTATEAAAARGSEDPQRRTAIDSSTGSGT